ncbi:uncharacterized protein LOC126739808 [Anthonomus grandis grandis]|uniref:uncharacterized protein LOC126739808 n=1 Tax=Anthonomus grandis grandis TaxID=2921223 RepID=UPI0021655E57|nr:uncharacterized protein LOC126739808 [Anthonomus grandis grandis]
MVITINFEHTHNIAESFSYLRMDKRTEETFLKYFEDGMTPSAARIFHEISLIESIEDTKQLPILLADAQKNPRERQIKYLYDKWRHINYGDRDKKSVVSVLKKKQYDFLQNSATALVRENPLIITVVTPIMKRASECRFSQEVVFVDSSGRGNKIGAIPLAIVLQPRVKATKH